MELRARGYKVLGFGVAVVAAVLAAVLVTGAQPALAETFSSYNEAGSGRVVYSSQRTFTVQGNVLYQKKGSTTKKLKKLPASGDAGWMPAAAYKNNVYLTKASFDKWKLWTYTYNVKSKKLKKVRTNCDIVAFKGAYAVAGHDYKSDVSANRMDVYKMTSSGLRHLKKLTSYGFEVEFIGSKIYYTVANNVSMAKNSLYKANRDGKSAKRVATFKTSQEYGQTIIYDITSKNCKVGMDGKQYLYTYKTKKLAVVAGE